MKIQIVLGSTRPGRIGEGVARWVYEVASKRTDAEFELVDIADFNLPILDEPMPAMTHQYANDHTKKWSSKLSQADGYIFVATEYNHSVPGALKNAIDYLNVEWRDKSVGFVGYGSVGATRSIEHLRGIAGELHLADVRDSLHLFLSNDFENYSVLKATAAHEEQLTNVIDGVVRWGGAMKSLRESSAVK